MLKQECSLPLSKDHIWCPVFPLGIIFINPSTTILNIIKSSTVIEPVRILIERPIPRLKQYRGIPNVSVSGEDISVQFL
jgi:hypothetical protein